MESLHGQNAGRLNFHSHVRIVRIYRINGFVHVTYNYCRTLMLQIDQNFMLFRVRVGAFLNNIQPLSFFLP